MALLRGRDLQDFLGPAQGVIGALTRSVSPKTPPGMWDHLCEFGRGRSSDGGSFSDPKNPSGASALALLGMPAPLGLLALLGSAVYPRLDD
jgi:hypothetical protein